MTMHGRPHRAARVSVPNQERAIISLEGTKTVGVLRKLSLTGGSVRLPKFFASGSLGQITLRTATGKISAAIEFLRASQEPQVQAFRFIHLDPGDRRQLEIALQQMLKQGLGDKGLRPLSELAQFAFGMVRKAVG